MKVISIVGARPQFIKAAMVSCDLRKHHEELLVHTGQHYDDNMSRLFFDEMGIPKPDVNLDIRSGSHGAQTAAMLTSIEEFLIAKKPEWVLVYGDTNSTLAGALVACKLRIPLVHVEAGLRSFNREMPEEHNRVLTDHCADLLLCPTERAMSNLKNEGIVKGVHLVGDVMYDAVLQYGALASRKSNVLERLKLQSKKYLLATVHRAGNTDKIEKLREIMNTFVDLKESIIFPVHPRTLKILNSDPEMSALTSGKTNLKLIDPVGYLDMLMLEQNARVILTDSGGVQKEAYFFGIPCITLREETEWVETVEAGWNILAGASRNGILGAVENILTPSLRPAFFGDGRAAVAVVQILEHASKA